MEQVLHPNASTAHATRMGRTTYDTGNLKRVHIVNEKFL